MKPLRHSGLSVTLKVLKPYIVAPTLFISDYCHKNVMVMERNLRHPISNITQLNALNYHMKKLAERGC